jgi:hypothetical protein
LDYDHDRNEFFYSFAQKSYVIIADELPMPDLNSCKKFTLLVVDLPASKTLLPVYDDTYMAEAIS